MEVRHGTLLNVYGIPVRGGGYTFMPADVGLEGDGGSLDHRLGDHCGDQGPPSLRFPIRHGFDAAWVRARIPHAFGFTPGPSEVEKTLVHLGFAAVTGDGSACYPFVCMDHYGRTALLFGDPGPEAAVRRAIAEAFWDVLARDPDDLADFEQRVDHPGAVEGLNYGCRSGHVYRDQPE